MCRREIPLFGLYKDVREAGICDGAIFSDEERLFVIGKSRFHSLKEAAVSILIVVVVVEVLGKAYRSELTYASSLVRYDPDSTNLREVILKGEAVSRGGKKWLLRQISLDFEPRRFIE
jgi:hypothetical protein